MHAHAPRRVHVAPCAYVEHVLARTRASPPTRTPPAQVKDAELNYGVLSQLLGHPKAELAHPNLTKKNQVSTTTAGSTTSPLKEKPFTEMAR